MSARRMHSFPATGGARAAGPAIRGDKTSRLSGEQLPSYLEGEGIKLAACERWRIALEEDSGGCAAKLKRIRQLERELTRKEKTLAEAAVLLVLKKTIDGYYNKEDDDTDEPSERSF